MLITKITPIKIVKWRAYNRSAGLMICTYTSADDPASTEVSLIIGSDLGEHLVKNTNSVYAIFRILGNDDPEFSCYEVVRPSLDQIRKEINEFYERQG